MPIPDYQALMLPLLKLASDGREHTNAEASEKLGAQLNLAEEERREMLASGQTKFSNRVNTNTAVHCPACCNSRLARPGFLSLPARNP